VNAAEGIEAQAVGVVDLVGVACRDVVVDARQRGAERLLVDVGADVGDAGRLVDREGARPASR
jgi:hypothetical protein